MMEKKASALIKISTDGMTRRQRCCGQRGAERLRQPVERMG